MRMPRSHNITRVFPPAKIYSADISNSSMVAESPRLSKTAVRVSPMARKRLKFCILRAPSWKISTYLVIISICETAITSTTSGKPVEKLAWEDKNIEALVWKPFVALKPENIEPAWNDLGEFNGIYYRSVARGRPNFAKGDIFGNSKKSDSGLPDIPLEKALWSVNERDSVFGSLWGFPRIARAYRHWWSSLLVHALADRMFETKADPPAVVYYPSDEDGEDSEGNTVDFRTVALEIGRNIRSGGTVALPSGLIISDDDKITNQRKWEINFLEPTSNFDAFQERLNYLDVMKLRSVMVPEQSLMEGGGGSSSRNVAEQMGQMFFEAQSLLSEEEDRQINRFLIPQLVEANFGPGVEAEKVTTAFSPRDQEMSRMLIQLFGQQDPNLLEVDIRELLRQTKVPLADPTIAENKVPSNPPKIEPKKGFAGVNQFGQYYSPDKLLTLSENKNREIKAQRTSARKKVPTA